MICGIYDEDALENFDENLSLSVEVLPEQHNSTDSRIKPRKGFFKRLNRALSRIFLNRI